LVTLDFKDLILKISRELKAAVTVLTAVILLIFGYNFLKGNNLLSNQKTFHVVYDNIEGLNSASVVTINGLQVGKILDIKFIDKIGRLKVSFSVDTDFEFGVNSIAKIYSSGLVSGKALAIVPEQSPSVMATDGAVLTGEIDEDLMTSISQKIDPLQVNLNALLLETHTTMKNLNQLLGKNNISDFSKVLENLNQVLDNSASLTNNMNRLVLDNQLKVAQSVNNFAAISENTKELSENLTKLEINSLVTKLDQSLSSVQNILKYLEEPKGSVGKLLQDPALYTNLEASSKQLELLLQDFRLQPKRYVHFSVFGRKDKEKKEQLTD